MLVAAVSQSSAQAGSAALCSVGVLPALSWIESICNWNDRYVVTSADPWGLDSHGKPCHRPLKSQGQIASRRHDLAAGGFNFAYLETAELYDPASGTWTSSGSLVQGRIFHRATLLSNGEVRCRRFSVCMGAPSRAQNSTIRKAGLGQTPAASSLPAVVTRRRCHSYEPTTGT